MPRFGETAKLDAQVDVEDLIEWVKENCDPIDVFDLDDLNDAVSDHQAPEDVFAKEDLETWALNNGFVRETETE